MQAKPHTTVPGLSESDARATCEQLEGRLVSLLDLHLTLKRKGQAAPRRVIKPVPPQAGLVGSLCCTDGCWKGAAIPAANVTAKCTDCRSEGWK